VRARDCHENPVHTTTWLALTRNSTIQSTKMSARKYFGTRSFTFDFLERDKAFRDLCMSTIKIYTGKTMALSLLIKK
jgi:hypothetical protein